MTKPLAIDFFAGAGLATLGLKESFDVIWANDICFKKQEVYERNHGTGHFVRRDIKTLHGSHIPSAHLSWASFPCQDVSLAGNQFGLAAARSGLFWEWLRILDETPHKPSVVCLENVVGLLSSHKGKDFDDLFRALTSRGYRTGGLIIDAAHWLPQSRPRVFVIGALSGKADLGNLHSEPSNSFTNSRLRSVAERSDGWVWWHLEEPSYEPVALESIVDWNAPCVSHQTTVDLLKSGLSEVQMKKLSDALISGVKVMPAYRRTRNGKAMIEIRFDGKAGCLRTPNGGSSRQRFLLLREGMMLDSRLITAREAARLMGAGDYWLPTNYNDAYRAMGDAVAVPVVQHLARHLLLPLVRHINNEQSTREIAQTAA